MTEHQEKKLKSILTENVQEIVEEIPTTTQLTFARFEGTGEEDEIGFEIPKKVVAVFSFSKKNFGFGDITLVRDENGQMYVDSERISKETVLEIFKDLFDEAIFDWEEDPEKHRRYHEVMGGWCSKCPTKQGQ